MRSIRKLAGTAVLFLLMMLIMAGPIRADDINVKVLNLRVGNSYKLKVSGAKKVTWKSSKKSVVTVSKKGVVKAKKAGSAKITAKAGKKKYTCKVTVKKKSSKTTASGSAGSVTKTSGKFSSAGLSGDELAAWKTITGYQKKYPEGKRFTNDDYYRWNGGIYRGGYGCAAFCFLLSDACFGTNYTYFYTPIKSFDLNSLRPGDILRLDYDTHSVTVVNKTSGGVLVAEANYNKSVHWGRKITFTEIKKTGSNVMTRYSTKKYTSAELVRMQTYLPVLGDPID